MSPAKPDLKNVRVELIKITELHHYPNNPRIWTQLQLDQLKSSIRRNGWLEPIVVNRAEGSFNVILGGNMRFCAAKELGYTEIPAICVNVKEKKKEREIVLRLNKNTGSWDIEKLKEFEVGFLLEIGFDDSDLGKIWDEALGAEDDQFDVEKAISEIKKPKSKLGDLYDLAGHRLLCGDSTDPNVVRRLVGKHRMDMLYFDPPYNISLDYSAGVSNKMQYGGKTKDNKSDEDYREFLKKTIENGLSVSKPDCHVFAYCDQKYIGMLQSLYPELGVVFKRVTLWIKNNFNMTPQVAFNKCYEPCVYGTRGSPYLSPRAQNFTEILNKEISNGNRTIDDILDMVDIWLCKRLPTTEYEHPTAKNPTLHERPLRRCTKPGDTILDVFGGSGSTLIAAHQMKRRCFLVEWDPVFVDVILRRFEAAFSIKPTLIKS
jgi:DNA modification methylase